MTAATHVTDEVSHEGDNPETRHRNHRKDSGKDRSRPFSACAPGPV